MSKPKKFKRKWEARDAVEECQRNGWKAGIIGHGPWFVNAISIANGQRIVYDLHDDGYMHEYSKKEVA